MGCTCDGYPEPEPDTHNGPVAEALCRVMQEHEARGEMGCFTKADLEWWAEHKRRDQLRILTDLKDIKEKEAKEKALAKLSPYERSLLRL